MSYVEWSRFQKMGKGEAPVLLRNRTFGSGADSFEHDSPSWRFDEYWSTRFGGSHSTNEPHNCGACYKACFVKETECIKFRRRLQSFTILLSSVSAQGGTRRNNLIRRSNLKEVCRLHQSSGQIRTVEAPPDGGVPQSANKINFSFTKKHVCFTDA